MSFRRSPFLIAAEKSGLFTSQKLTSLTGDTQKIVHQLLSSDELTQFQADKLQAGLWQGLTLGPYRVLAPIGRGGMGVVYLAAKGETNAGQRFALKILPPRVAKEEPRRLERFYREIRIGKMILPHGHVAQTHEGGSVNGVNYLAMEYVPGLTLRKRVQEKGSLPIEEAAAIGAGVAQGLSHIHSFQIIHRDLKPANVILAPGGRAKILDFGFAIISGEPLSADPRVTGGQGYVIGTMDYIAPEQIVDAMKVTPASDLYSLGCTLFYSLTGTPPYPGGDAQQKLKWHQSSEPPDVRSINPAVTEEFAKLVSRLLRKDPDRRPQSAMDVAGQLREIAGPEVLTIDPVGFETAVGILTHQKVETAEVLEPIFIEDDLPAELPTRKQRSGSAVSPLFWCFIAGLIFLILVLASTLFFLLTTRKH